MKQWLMKANATGVDDLVLEDVPRPEPGHGEVRIRVRAVSINYRDQLILKGPFGRLPGRSLVPLSDVAGEVDAIGAGVQGWAIGDRVTNTHFLGWEDGPAPPNLGLGLGALDLDGVLAEDVVLPAKRITRAPSNLDFVEAATLPVAGVTAWNAIAADHRVSNGQKVLIVGSGGVSLFALQLARALRAKVFGIVQHDGNAANLRALGVEALVNTASTPEWGQAVFELTGGVQKVIDTIGPGALNKSLRAVAAGGEVAMIGLFEMAGVPLDATQMLSKGVNLRGISVGSARMHRDLVEMIELHDIHPVIDRRVPFRDARDAFRAQLSKDLFGKVVLEVA